MQLSRATEGLTGSEIENAFVEALYMAFDAGEKEPTDLDIAQVLTEFVPLSKLMAEQIAGLRQWAKGRARLATSQSGQSGHGSRVVVGAGKTCGADGSVNCRRGDRLSTRLGGQTHQYVDAELRSRALSRLLFADAGIDASSEMDALVGTKFGVEQISSAMFGSWHNIAALI